MLTRATLMISIVTLALDVEARAGGGGRGGGKGSAIGTAIAVVIYAIMDIRRRKMMKKAKADLVTAKAKDSTWDEAAFQDVVGKTFYRYQEAWTNGDLAPVRSLLHIDYFEKASNILNIEMKDQKNILKSPKVLSLNLMAVRDVPGQDGDMFAMEVNASMVDYTIEKSTGKFIESTLSRDDGETQSSYEQRAQVEAGEFREYWVFQRVSGSWKLWEIEDSSSIVRDLQGKSELDLRRILAREQESPDVDDSVFFKKS